MKYCPYCGNYNSKNGNFCEGCGARLKNDEVINNYYNVNNSNKKIEEGSTFGWGLLGFFIPLAGVILFFAWLNDRPKASKSAGIGALIRVIITIILFFVAVVFFVITEPNYDRKERNNYPREYREKYYEDDWT